LKLRQIQNYSLPGQITSGSSLNFLLGDVAKYPNKKTALEPVMLNEAVLSQLNVTKNTYSIGILRDGGKFSWPAAFHEMVKANKREDIEARVQSLYKEAHREGGKGRVDPNKLQDIRNEMDAIRTNLVEKVHEIHSAQYMDAKRFLQEFY